MRLLFALALASLGAQQAMAAPIAGVTVTAGTPINFNTPAGLAALTDGVIDDNDWLTGPYTSLGWLDAAFVPGAIPSVDSGVSQPLLTFDLGGTYVLNSVTVHYTIDQHPGNPTSNLHAPDQMTATFSAAGPGGPFANPLIQTGWDDSDAGDSGVLGMGVAKSFTTNLGGVVANSVRLDFLTDAEWLFISEITFDGSLVPEPASLGMLAMGLGAVGLSRRRVVKRS